MLVLLSNLFVGESTSSNIFMGPLKVAMLLSFAYYSDQIQGITSISIVVIIVYTLMFIWMAEKLNGADCWKQINEAKNISEVIAACCVFHNLCYVYARKLQKCNPPFWRISQIPSYCFSVI